jgi:2-C-methyl-D-erythritol 4-phosphate cytidylyltransferase/2-C-methyl-D-erythritol 2,4-cyclodiphosphate synthase
VKIYAIIPAAGSGSRFGSALSKTLIPIKNKPAVFHAAEKLCRFSEKVFVVIRKDELADFERALNGLTVEFVLGGATRRESVQNALNKIKDLDSIALIHDGARPLVSEKLIKNLIDAAKEFGAAVPSLKITDTVKRSFDGEYIDSTVDRDKLYTVQTPQAFRTDWLKKAYSRFLDNTTDDAALMEKLGKKVKIVRGEKENIKITYKEDIAMAEKFVGLNPVRIGFGYDVHRLVEGKKLVLCGVHVPFEKGLKGHSDADAAVHALIDALLGAAALGDIGVHFPDSSDEFKGISSLVLLAKVKDILAERALMPYNVDVTIAAQMPKLSPFIPAMRKNIADTLNIQEEFVSIKATTTERLGFEGRGEGVAAYAVASLCG